MINDIIDNVLAASSSDDLIASLARAKEMLEFEYFAFGMRVHLPATSPKLDILSNYPTDWQSAYQNNRYDVVDPIVPNALASYSPIAWSREIYPSQGDFWEEAESYGVSYGCSQSVDSQGVSGILSFSRPNHPMTISETLKIQAELITITYYVHTKFSELIAPKRFPEKFAHLTVREKDVLRWCADGKTSFEISMLLSISERTVNFHLNNIFEKLNVTNKTAACVKAISYRLI